jgi:hypothetical protein
MKTTKELIEDLRSKREAEIKEYYKELSDFLKERDIDLSASVTISNTDSNKVSIFIIDKL